MKRNALVQTISAQANACEAGVKLANARGRSQNRLHVQKALMEYLLLGKLND
ncbi:MAG: hypothetical protein KKF58_04685 [Gammaproteobacteria bacterium]|nr:hypothetical protein [Gammaproteobacteria bacterium]MDD5472440.1 hypothetical protein [Sideroxydans sp.]